METDEAILRCICAFDAGDEIWVAELVYKSGTRAATARICEAGTAHNVIFVL